MGKKYTLRVDGKEVTKDGLKERFDRYNKLYFWGKLGKCDFFWLATGPGFCGKYAEKKAKNGKISSRIGITRSVRWTDETLKELMVHEMIHMYVSTVEGKAHDGVLGHGRRFRAHCKRLKNDFGLSIRKNGGFEETNKKPSTKIWEKVLLWLIDW
ncbi:MAG: SprT-like domain-containing protein [Muribaculaceae bacterium]|nr:SprT-like domain-containing protein [Muribaculaceae bacterium]